MHFGTMHWETAWITVGISTPCVRADLAASMALADISTKRRSQDESRGQPGHWGIENNNHVVATGGSTQHLKHKGKPTVRCEIRHTAHALPKSMRISSSGVSMLHLSQVSRIQFILNPKRSESTSRLENHTLFSGYTGLQHTCSEAPNGHVGLHPKP